MFCVHNQSVNVPPHQTCSFVTSIDDEAWNVEWGKLRPLYGGMGSWHVVQHFGGSCPTVQEQSVSTFHDDEEADSDEDKDELGQAAFSEVVGLELPSIGSKDHAIGECKRCAFYFKGRCRNGKDCSHCHLPHDETRRRRNRKKTKASADTVEDNNDYEGDLEDDIDEFTKPPAAQVHSSKALLLGTPVHLPAQISHEGFNGMLAFGSVTPELQPQVGSATSQKQCCAVGTDSSMKADNEEEDQTCNVHSEAFSSLWSLTEKTSCSAHAKAESTNSDVQSINSDDEVSQLEEMEAEVARLEEEALAAEREAQQILEKAMVAKKQRVEEPKAASVPASELTNNAAVPKDEKARNAEEGETTASSEESRSDTSGSTEHDFSSNCSDKSDPISSDSDSASPREEAFSQRQEQQPHQTHKQISDAVRSPIRSPLWPSCLPVPGPVESQMTKMASLSAGEPQKEKVSWAALARARRRAAEASAAEDPEVAVVRQARGILNKLTDTNFETLYKQLVGCGICSATQLEALITEIFDKATAQHGFLPMYVELCERLNGHFEKHPIEGADFRKVLVGACQRTFEKTLRCQPEVDKDLSYEDRYEIELKFKTRMLGNLRFVGELLVRKLLAGKVLLAVSEELLSVGDGAAIEAAATLLKVAGPSFDRKSWVFVPRLHAIFSMLRCLSKDKAIPMRVRCILKDLLELRDAGWQKKN